MNNLIISCSTHSRQKFFPADDYHVNKRLFKWCVRCLLLLLILIFWVIHNLISQKTDYTSPYKGYWTVVVDKVIRNIINSVHFSFILNVNIQINRYINKMDYSKLRSFFYVYTFLGRIILPAFPIPAISVEFQTSNILTYSKVLKRFP